MYYNILLRCVYFSLYLTVFNHLRRSLMNATPLFFQQIMKCYDYFSGFQISFSILFELYYIKNYYVSSFLSVFLALGLSLFALYFQQEQLGGAIFHL